MNIKALTKQIVLFYFSLLILSHANEDVLLQRIKDTPLLHNGAQIIEENGSVYLIGVGSSVIRDIGTLAKVNAIKESQLKAQKSIIYLIHGSNIETDESLSKQTITETKTIDNKVVSQKVANKKLYERVIKEQGNGILVNLKKLGYWQDGNRYYFGYYLLVAE